MMGNNTSSPSGLATVDSSAANEELLKPILAAGAVNMVDSKSGLSLLHLACYRGDISLVKLLLSKKEVDIHVLGSTGYTPLHIAVLSQHLEIVKLLCQH